MMKPTMGILVLALSMTVASRADATVKVVATVPSLAAIAGEVGGEHVSVTSLSLPTQDPHFVDARPSLALELNRAALLLVVGLELEQGWLPPLLTGARNGRIQLGAEGYLDCSGHVRLLDAPQGVVARRMGDVHSGGNPHYLFDPRNGAQVAEAVAARLATLDPEHAEAYRTSAKRFREKLERAREGWEKRLAPPRGAQVVGYHKSWVYLAEWLGFVEVDFVEPKPGIPPNPSHVAKVLAKARAGSVRMILQEVFYADSTTRLIADRIPAALVKVPGGADFRAGQGYVEHLEQVVSVIERALGERVATP